MVAHNNIQNNNLKLLLYRGSFSLLHTIYCSPFLTGTAGEYFIYRWKKLLLVRVSFLSGYRQKTWTNSEYLYLRSATTLHSNIRVKPTPMKREYLRFTLECSEILLGEVTHVQSEYELLKISYFNLELLA